MRKRRKTVKNKRNKIVSIILLMGPILGAIDGILFEHSVSDVFNSRLKDYLCSMTAGAMAGLEISLATIIVIVGIKYLIKIFKN